MLVASALSVHSFIDKVGNYLGFAALVGVALLVIMFFVQAHETARLRERAEDAEEDLDRLRQYAEQVARQAAQAQQSAQAAQAAQTTGPRQPTRAAPPAVAAAVATTGASRTATGPAGGASGVAPASARPRTMPFAPVGVGAPALSSATRLIPLAEPTPAPSTPAAAEPVAPRVTTPPPVTTAAAPAVPVAAAPTAAAPAPSRAPRRDYGRAEEESRSRVGFGSLLVAGVLVAVIIVAAVLVITHHSSHHAAARSAHVGATTRHSATRTTGHGKTKVVHVNPTQVRVAVLNGTNTYDLAADVSARLNKVGFQQGITANYVDQDQTATVVGYLPNNSAQGQAVAKALGVSVADVHQISPDAEKLVCPSGPSQCSDQVVVTVGSNLNSDAS